MSDTSAPTPPVPSREERLAAKLRENLRRRKAQARELGLREETGPDETGGEALPKAPPSR